MLRKMLTDRMTSLWKSEQVSPYRVIIIGFFLLIMCGALLLMLPISTVGPGGAPFLDALFTATSATCVTGLVVHDTVTYWTTFGQLVIMLLIQVGGMGVVTMGVAIFIFSGKRIGLKQRWVMQESISAPQVGGIVRMTGFILRTALAIELTGALLLSFRFIPRFGLIRGAWYSLFHSVSAFCNAGFDLLGAQTPFSSLTGYSSDPLINLTISTLIVVGGLGFVTWQDFASHKLHFKRYRLQSKIVLVTTVLLILGGFFYLDLYEFRLAPWDHLNAGDRLLASWFQSITPRTAGFNTVDLAQLSSPTHAIMIMLMVTGGSPGSTAGGYKTTTLAVLLLSAVSVFRRRSSTECFGRRLPETVLRNACAIFLMYIVLFSAGGMLICCIDGIPLVAAFFEAASAIGTVGLTLGYTTSLSAPSRLILIFLMYFGRVGGLTMIYAVTSNNTGVVSQFPQESVTVG